MTSNTEILLITSPFLIVVIVLILFAIRAVVDLEVYSNELSSNKITKIFIKEHGTDGILKVVNHHRNCGSILTRKIRSMKKSYNPFRKTKDIDGPCFKRSFLRKVKKFERANHDKRNEVFTDFKVRVRDE